MKRFDDVQHSGPAGWTARTRGTRRSRRDGGGDRCRIAWRGGRRRDELLAGLGEQVTTRRTEQIVVTHLGEPLGQHVLQKAAEERDGVEGAPLDETCPAIAVAERHRTVLEPFEAAVDQRDAEDVAREVLEHLLARPGMLNVHDPFVIPDGERHLIEKPRLPE
jgi:hypothetical protein